MNKILFTCDVDNTLIYSYKHRQEGDICVEILKDKEQGFTTARTLELLKSAAEVEGLSLVPLTTRSIEQYERIKFGEGAPKQALVTNGTLLIDGQTMRVDELWWMETLLSSVNPVKQELDRLYALLTPMTDSFIRVRIVDEMYLFVYCADKVDPAVMATMLSMQTTLKVEYSGKKIYFFPSAADKGVAAKRMAERLGADILIAAGDSSIDLPMLRQAELAIIPQGLAKYAEEFKRAAVCPEGERFSEFVLETAIAAAKEFIAAAPKTT